MAPIIWIVDQFTDLVARERSGDHQEDDRRKSGRNAHTQEVPVGTAGLLTGLVAPVLFLLADNLCIGADLHLQGPSQTGDAHPSHGTRIPALLFS